MSKLINSISKENNNKFSNNIFINNYNNKNDDIMSFINQRKNNKQYILKDEILSKN